MSVNLPPSYVPPSPARKSGPGCWVWGFCTCLVVFIIFAVLSAVALEKAASTKSGQSFFKSFGSAVQSAQQVQPAMMKMQAIQQAVVRYHTVTGSYPANLKVLVPTYLTGPSPLHTSIDSNTDPEHISFVYKKPAENAPGSTVILTTDWSYTVEVGPQQQTVDTTMSMTLDGKILSRQSQTVVLPTKPNLTTTTSGV